MTDKPDPGQRPQPPAPRGPIRAHMVNAWRYSVIFLAWYSVKTFLFLKSHIHIKRWFGGNAREVAVRLWTMAWLTFVWVLLWGTYDIATVVSTADAVSKKAQPTMIAHDVVAKRRNKSA